MKFLRRRVYNSYQWRSLDSWHPGGSFLCHSVPLWGKGLRGRSDIHVRSLRCKLVLSFAKLLTDYMFRNSHYLVLCSISWEGCLRTGWHTCSLRSFCICSLRWQRCKMILSLGESFGLITCLQILIFVAFSIIFLAGCIREWGTLLKTLPVPFDTKWCLLLNKFWYD